MSEPARFQRSEQLRRDGDVLTSRGIDAVTGLAVLLYDFPGAPRLKPGQLASEGVPTILAAGYDGANGVLVTAYPQGAVAFAGTKATADDGFVLQALAILKDAARVGLVHGGLGPERFLLSHGRLYLEGYGVPWNPAALEQPSAESIRTALASDLAATVRALLTLGGADMSGEVAAALKGALQKGARGGDAGRLHAVVRRLAGGAVTVPSAGFGDLVLPTAQQPRERTSRTALDDLGLTGDLDLTGDLAASEPTAPDAGAANLERVDLDELDLSPRASHEPRAAARPSGAAGAHQLAPQAARPEPVAPPAALFATPGPGEGRSRALTPAFPDDPDPITLHSDPGPTLTVDKRLKDSGAGFVKDLPPGATYRAGNTEEAVRVPPISLDVNAVPQARKLPWRVPLLLLTLLLVAGGAGYLALVANRDAGTSLPGSGAANFIVDVRVDPPNMPPANLVVEQSPAGSSRRAGTILGSVPRRVSFDAPGTWVVHATFLGRVSQSVTLRVPGDTAIEVVFPPEQQP